MKAGNEESMPITHLMTEQGEKLLKTLAVSPDTIPWNIYPRPLLQRDSFYCLNGYWTFCFGEPVTEREETILVPFPPESLLSGICRDMGKEASVYYRRHFVLPAGFIKDSVLLHFGAVDQSARVVLNGTEVGCHRGGYDAFSFDITALLQEENTLEVYVKDTDSDKTMPYGKQKHKRGGMWYTPVTGIWQTVWLESVPEAYIRSLTITTTLDSVTILAEGADTAELAIETPEGTCHAEMKQGKAVVRFDTPHLWTPENPYLYHFTVKTASDTVRSYFALRTIETCLVDGKQRICLNGEPVFLHGLLDQGYYSDGIYTPASPASYTEDIQAMKSLGFNTLRKHIKVEPAHFYSECDRLGMLVVQDMVNNGKYNFIRDTALPTIGVQKIPDRHMHNNKFTRKAFTEKAEATVRQLFNHPCICCWTIFNEGWGQFDGAAMYERMKAWDPTRIADTASGWFSGVPSDVESIHIYFRPVKIRQSDKPVFLSEFGGYACPVSGHVFNPEKVYGYRLFTEQEEFAKALHKLYEEEILPAIPLGLCGAVYTQVSDVEDETNGLLTYDRKVCKADPETMREIAERLYGAIKTKNQNES